MSEEITTDTLVAGENVQPVGTDTDAETTVEAKSEKSVKTDAPKVEHKEGKLFVDGVRVYTRDDTNKIAARAKDEAVSGILSDLEVDSLDKVKGVVKTLQSSNPETGLNVDSLRDAVKKKEQTVEELRAELQSVKTEYALKDHISSIKDNMPTSWNTDQKQAVVDLMKARNMLHLEGDTFAIKNGEDYFTVDGETPDYKTAVEVVGKTIGLPFAKKGVDTFAVDKQPAESGVQKAVDAKRMKQDPEYRSAYVRLRERNRTIDRRDITDKMVTDQMKTIERGSTEAKMLR
tara:strand:- start:2418 stop:3284 length:867 start_codon:yes stop_codon:yes gene_type:complete